MRITKLYKNIDLINKGNLDTLDYKFIRTWKDDELTVLEYTCYNILNTIMEKNSLKDLLKKYVGFKINR